MNENIAKIIRFYGVKERQTLIDKKEIYVSTCRSKECYFLYIVAMLYYEYIMMRSADHRSFISVGWLLWGVVGYCIALFLFEEKFNSWSMEGRIKVRQKYEFIARCAQVLMPVLMSRGIIKWRISMLDEKSSLGIFIGFLFYTHILLYFLQLTNFFIWGIIFKIVISKVSNYEKEIKEIKEENEEIEKENKKISEQNEKVDNIEQLKIIQDIPAMQYVGNAIDLYYEENYEDSVANVRRALECYLYQRIEQAGIMFTDEKELNTFSMIKKIDNIPALHYIRKTCNSCVHTLSGDTIIQREDAENVINSLLYQLVKYSNFYKPNTSTIEEINSNLNIYIERTKKHIEKGNLEDALLNIRKALECMVRGYIKSNHIVCTYGYELNLSGYIDTLYKQNIITENSKNIMHKIRMASNKGAHTESGQIRNVENINNIIYLLEQELAVYMESQKNEQTGEMILNQISEYEGNEEFIEEDMSDEYDEEYDYNAGYDDCMSDYDECMDDYVDCMDDYDYNNVYYDDNYVDDTYQEDDDFHSKVLDPQVYYDSSYYMNPFVQSDPMESLDPYCLFHEREGDQFYGEDTEW